MRWAHFIGLERIVEESTDSYYETLEASSQGLARCCSGHRAHGSTIFGVPCCAFTMNSKSAWAASSKGDRVRSEILKRQLPFSISEIEESCPDINRDRIRVVLRAMKADGIIAPKGQRRGAKWSQVKVRGNPDATATDAVSKPVLRLATAPTHGGKLCRIA